MKGMHSIFIMYAPVVGACFVAAWFVKDRGVAEKDASAVELGERVCGGTHVVNEGQQGHPETIGTENATHKDVTNVA